MKTISTYLMRNFLTMVMLVQFTFCIAQSGFDFNFSTPYGHNTAAGKYAMVNGFHMYYEEYGTGKPLLLIHGNGESIRSMGHQIEYFRNSYHVIVADSSGHRKSQLNTDSLTNVQMADDWAALADHLHIDSLYVLGWSDGGIIGLLLAMHHPEKVAKLAAMGANLRPDSTAVYNWAINWVHTSLSFVHSMIGKGDTSYDWDKYRQYLNLLGKQPSIEDHDLSLIKAPVLVLAGDKDIIREEHTVEIYQHIPHAQLCIFPGQTHFVPATDPDLFNTTCARFFDHPFQRPDSETYMH